MEGIWQDEQLPLPMFVRWSVSQKHKAPLLTFLIKGLESAGCRIIHASEPSVAPFLISFETISGERIAILVYAFLANSKVTPNRPEDEHRFQIKLGGDLSLRLPVQIDPLGVLTTLFVGIDPERGFLVGADPSLHHMSAMSKSIEFKRRHASDVMDYGWCAWERDRHGVTDEPFEVLVGASQGKLLDYIRFERLAFGLDQGHRQLLAEKFPLAHKTATVHEDHQLLNELKLSEGELLDLIGQTPRLKMAVRGWVAEKHLVDYLGTIPGVTDCHRLNTEGSPDVELRYRGSAPLLVECKNVSRTKLADGRMKIDFQRTRVSKGDPCTRYYSPRDFSIVAGCLHAATESWDFKFKPTHSFSAHKTCHEKLAPNVVLDETWMDVEQALRAAI